MSTEECIYEICLKGHLDEQWISWFEGFTISHGFDQEGEPVTWLSGVIADQAALHGVLIKVRDIGIPMLSVNRIPTGGRR